MPVTRRSFAFGLLALAACSSLDVNDPIVGVWTAEEWRWVFNSDHTVTPHPDDMERDTQIASIVYPSIRWRRIGSDRYALLYSRPWLPAHQRQERVEVRFRSGQLERVSDGSMMFRRG